MAQTVAPKLSLEEATDKLLAIVDGHLSQLSAAEQKAKWDGLERRLKSRSRGTHAKRRAPRSKRANSR